MLEEMSSEQLVEWEEFFRISPWGPGRDDARAMYIGEMAVAPYSKGGRANFGSFFPHLKTRQTPADHEAIFRRLCGQGD